MSKNKKKSTTPTIKLWKNKTAVQEVVDKIDFLTKAIFPRGDETTLLLKTNTVDTPVLDLPGLSSMGFVEKGLYLYRRIDTPQWLAFEHSLDLNDKSSGIDWICQVVPPNWGRDLPPDLLVFLASYLPIDKIFIMAGLCKKFRAIYFGSPGIPNEDKYWERLRGGGIKWLNHLSFIAKNQIPPRFPKSASGFTKADYLSTTDLVKWGQPMVKTMRRRGSRPAPWPPLAVLQEDEVRPLLVNDKPHQNICVMLGDMGVCIFVEVDASITPEVLDEHLRDHHAFKSVSRQAHLTFTIQCPVADVLKTLDNVQFKWMGLDFPTRDEETNEITSLPIRKDMVPWMPTVPIHFYRATLGWRVQVTIYERRAMKDLDNESLRQTIIQRFTDKRFCKHCYRWMDPRETKCVVPEEWTSLVPNVAPICIHCFTHMFQGDISSPVGSRDVKSAIRCPKCTRGLGPERDVAYRGRRLGQEMDRDAGAFNYYKCNICDGPRLRFAYVRKEIHFAPHVEAWKKLCMDQIPDDTEAMKKSKKVKKRRHIEALKLSIESDIESIRKTQSELNELGVDDYREIQVNEPRIKKIKLVFKKPAGKAPAGKSPRFGKRPMMSPTVPRRSGKCPKMLEIDEDEDEDEEQHNPFFQSHDDEDDFF